MTEYTLGAAAKATSLGKSTISRAIKSGRLSATRTKTGDWSIARSELHRVFPPVVNEQAVQQDDLKLRTAALEAEITILRELGSLLRSQLEDAQRDRDAWRDHAQATQRLLSRGRTPRHSWPNRRAGRE